MAIVELSKLNVIGLNDLKPQILKSLMDIGVVEISNQDAKLNDENWKQLVVRDGDDTTVQNLDSKISMANSALEAISKYDSGKKPLIKTRKPIKETDFEKGLKTKDETEEIILELNLAYKEIIRLKNEENRINTAIIGFQPWVSYKVPLEITGTRFTTVFMGTLPITAVLEEIENQIVPNTTGVVVYKVSSDEQYNYISVVCLHEEKPQVLDVLRVSGFNPITFTDMAGTPVECIDKLNEDLKKVNEEIQSYEKIITDLVNKKETIEMIHDHYVIENSRFKALSQIVKTKTSFYFDGYLPKDKENEVKTALDEFGCYYEFTAPEKGEVTPILLKQNKFSESFQSITDLYSTPSITDIDPTPFLAPFYFMFFGLMLSDAGYGVVLAVSCLILLKKFRLEGMMKRLVTLFMYCGISTAFWGVMFGSYFGDFFPVAAKSVLGIDITINPVWFSPISEPMTLLIFSFILGAIHLFTGMGLKAYILIKTGNTMDAICDIFLWYVLLTGLVLFGVGGSIAPIVATIGQWMSIIGAVGILLTGGRKKTGIGKLTGGLGQLYGITSYLSDVLSYARLLALGLATGVVAQVINTLGSLAGGGIVGAIVMLIAFVFGHTFNMAINVLGSFVHSSRLQYVEFFGKFFDGGGTAFNPFNKKTKYVEIIKEEK